MTEYSIIDGQWVWGGYYYDIIGVLFSIDSPEYYNHMATVMSIDRIMNSIKEPIITLQKHGKPEIVHDYYLQYVDSPLRQFCTFRYVTLLPTQINCDNLNKIISTSCLPVKYLNKLIEENVKEIQV
jgi:hypothetical protein